MKKSIFIILPLILWAFAACDNDDSEWEDVYKRQGGRVFRRNDHEYGW